MPRLGRGLFEKLILAEHQVGKYSSTCLGSLASTGSLIWPDSGRFGVEGHLGLWDFLDGLAGPGCLARLEQLGSTGEAVFVERPAGRCVFVGRRSDGPVGEVPAGPGAPEAAGKSVSVSAPHWALTFGRSSRFELESLQVLLLDGSGQEKPENGHTSVTGSPKYSTRTEQNRTLNAGYR